MEKTTWYFKDFYISSVFDKEFDEVVLYKAYFLDKVDDILPFQMDNDYVSVGPEDAAQFLLFQALSKAHTNGEELKLNPDSEKDIVKCGDRIVVLALKINAKDLRTVPLWNLEDHDNKKPYEWHGTMQIDLHNCHFNATKITQYVLEDFEINADEKCIGNSVIKVTLTQIDK